MYKKGSKNPKTKDLTRGAVRAYNETEEGGRYPSTGGEEIWSPEALQEVLEASRGVGTTLFPELQSNAPVVSIWRPDEVRKNRKLKQQAYWLKYKASRPKKMGRPLKWKTGWQKRKAPKDRLWKYYHGTVGANPWMKYSRIWKINGVDIKITPEEWEEIVEKCGGIHKIRRVTCYRKVASKETITVYSNYTGYKTKKKREKGTKILYRGSDVPASELERANKVKS